MYINNSNNNLPNPLSLVALFNTYLGMYNSQMNITQESNQKELMRRLDSIEKSLAEIKVAINKD